MKPLIKTALVVLVALAATGTARAQVGPATDIQTSGAAYFVYAEPGAPTYEVTLLGDGVRNGVFLLQEGTTLTRLIAIAGGVPTSEEGERQIVEAKISILREQGGTRVPIYEAPTEQALREPGAHPPFRDGDLVVLDVTYEEVRGPIRLIDVVNTASRVASLITAAILIYTRIDNI